MFKKNQPTYQILKKNPKKGLEIMYQSYGTKLCAYALKNWNLSEDEAWELIYKTMFKIEQNIKQYEFDNETKFAAFIYKTFINFLRNYYRDNKKKILETERIENIYQIEDTENNTSETKQVKQLNMVLEQLDEWQRILLLLRAQGMPYSEIALYIDKPEKQLKVYYQRLKAKIEKQLIKQNIEEKKKEVVYEK